MTVDPTVRELATKVLTPKQLEAWELINAGISQRELAYRLDVSRSAIIDRLDNAHRTLRRHGVHMPAPGIYYLEETA